MASHTVAVNRVKGFSLLELMLVLLLSSTLLLAWVGLLTGVWAQANRQQQLHTQAQLFYQLAFWLARDLERAGEQGHWRWNWQPDCLLYADHGVRMRQGLLQWRPQERGCDDSGWIALHDVNGFQLTGFALQALPQQQAMLRLSASYDDHEWEWRYLLPAPVVLEP